MKPGIGRSIGAGFRAANRSWPGMGLIAGISIGLFLIALVIFGGGIALTHMPEQLVRQLLTQGPVVPAIRAAAPQQAAPSAVAPRSTTAAQTETPSASTTSATAQPAAATTSAATSQPATDKQTELVQLWDEWFGRAWPVLLMCLLIGLPILIGVNVWLQGGQIGYVGRLVTNQQAALSEFWSAGTKAFGAMFGAWLISLGVTIALTLGVVLVAMLFGAVPNAVPSAVLGVLGFILAVAAVVALVWLAVRLSFWFIAIVMDHAGPMSGLKVSFQVTRGRWWKTFGLMLVLVLIAIGIGLVFRLFERAGNAAGGFGGGVLAFVVGVVQLIVNLYLGFVTTAAFIQFYQDTKAAPSGPAAPASP